MALAPIRGFWDIQSEFDRMFDEMVGSLFGRRRGGQERLWAPPMEVYAHGGDLVIHVDLPGVTLDDVDITLEGTTLTISGQRKGTEEEVNHYLQELPYGAFRRSMTVPEGVDADSVKARLENGVLEVVLPGAVSEVAPKKIAIEAGESRKTLEGSAS
ncbi:MAG: Hsp20/alpha crystallin family protein [Rubrobacteraceae bacterium]|uniref:Hsp20/alpha crystallin family protein n=1 Tax=Rubrobacter TaxID=42255 RepID=UPI002362524E|nr:MULTISPECIES: Hsp20/alpha crystallin family protein [Rubrobacter]MBX6763433.1 Hsp20/alpha crystallin family protein [Rubrobacteraceae bacterium]MCL6438167.1 Hsp20/alpha crystallin family protein [Rubrobacteraceae bacterium]